MAEVFLRLFFRNATQYFSIGRGDCPSGCIYRKYWIFEVANGVARFVGS